MKAQMKALIQEIGCLVMLTAIMIITLYWLAGGWLPSVFTRWLMKDYP